MARMPGAVWLGENSPRTPMERYDVVCVHTIVGFAPAHAAHFSTRADGTILQSRDTAYRSAANLDGNHRVIAIENEDHGPAFGGTPRLPAWVPLTDEQVDACARILAWAHEEHGIPLQLCPDSRPGSRGLAYHRQGVDGNFGAFDFPGRVSGGEKWSSAFGKVCPSDARIRQLPDILDGALTIVRGRTTTTPPPEDDMAAEDVWTSKVIPKADTPDPNDRQSAAWALAQARAAAIEARNEARAARAAVEALTKAVEALNKRAGG